MHVFLILLGGLVINSVNAGGVGSVSEVKDAVLQSLAHPAPRYEFNEG